MPPQIPSPIVAPQGRQDPMTQILMGMVSQAPGLIFEILDRQKQGQMEAETGRASQSVLQSLSDSGAFDQSLQTALGAAGATRTPGLPGGSAPATDAAPAVNVAPTPGRTDTSSIRPQTATQLLSQFLSTQESLSGIEAQRASTELSGARAGLAEVQTEGARTGNEIDRLNLEFAERTEPIRFRRGELENELLEAQIAGEDARLRQLQKEDNRLQIQEERLRNQAVADQVRSMRSEALNYAQFYSSFPGMDASSARQLGAMAAFGQADMPSDEDLRARAEGILTGDIPPPSEEQERTSFAARVGLGPQNQSAIDQGLARFETAQEAFDALKQQVRGADIPEERKAQILHGSALYINRYGEGQIDLKKALAEERGSLGPILDRIKSFLGERAAETRERGLQLGRPGPEDETETSSPVLP